MPSTGNDAGSRTEKRKKLKLRQRSGRPKNTRALTPPLVPVTIAPKPTEDVTEQPDHSMRYAESFQAAQSDHHGPLEVSLPSAVPLDPSMRTHMQQRHRNIRRDIRKTNLDPFFESMVEFDLMTSHGDWVSYTDVLCSVRYPRSMIAPYLVDALGLQTTTIAPSLQETHLTPRGLQRPALEAWVFIKFCGCHHSMKFVVSDIDLGTPFVLGLDLIKWVMSDGPHYTFSNRSDNTNVDEEEIMFA